MRAAALLRELDQLGVELWPQGERLCYRSPKGVLDPNLLDSLRDMKAEILRELHRRRLPVEELPHLTPEPNRRAEPFAPSAIQQAYLLGRTDLFQLGNVGPTSYVELDWRDLDLERLKEAWWRLIVRHDMLRVVSTPDGLLRILDDVPPVAIAVEDLRDLRPDEVEERLTELRRAGSERLFDPESWPLFEVRASLLDAQTTRLHVSRDLLISDVRSSGILFEELLRLYARPGTELPPLEISVRDYAVALERLREHPAYRRSRAYWEARLPTLPPSPELPAVRDPRGPDGRHRFARHHATFDAELSSRLSRQASTRGLTPSVVLCATFAEVLGRWSNSLRFVINVLHSHRLPLHPQVERLVGNFASTLPLEVDLSGEAVGSAPFEERAHRLQERLWEDVGHGLVSGVEVLRELNRRLGQGQRAAMPVVFSSALPFARQAATELTETSRLEGGPFTTVYHSVQTPQVMLEILVTEARGALHLTWNVVEGLFPDGFIEAMFDTHRRWIRWLATDDSAWKEVDPELVPRRQLERRARVNRTSVQEPGLPLHRLATVAPPPAEVAVVAGSRRLSYGELGSRAASLAAVLRDAGAAPERLVAVVLDKGWEQVVAVLGILRSGAAYLPIDPTLPRERRLYLLEHADVELVVTRPELAAELDWPDGVCCVPIVEDDEPPPEPPSGDGGEAASRIDALAYVIFTSGSTGLPKGVMIEHRAAANTVADINRRLGLSARDRVLALSSLSFDLSVWDLFGPLAAGGRIILPGPGAPRDPVHWHRLMSEEAVTVWNSVPALMEIYVEFLEGRGERLPASLHTVMLSGDWIPVTLPDRIRALGDGVRVISLGGATEASIWSIAYRIGTVDPAWSAIPYGMPLDNQCFHVLDERLRPCPDGVAGSLFIGGVGLARGYWKDPKKTAVSFLPRPVTGARLYRTGDLGRYLDDGNIEFLGREDLQVKIQGYRVELGEIESTLARHPAIREAVVVAAGEEKGHKRLVAFFVPRAEAAVEEDRLAASELRSFLAGKLPEYMVPSVIQPLEAIPLTANGKIDRERLVGLQHRAPTRGTGAAPAASGSPIEARIGEIWRELLERDPIGVDENFFELGGDSMLALRLLARVEKEFSIRLPLAAVYQEGTVAHLAALVERGDAS